MRAYLGHGCVFYWSRCVLPLHRQLPADSLWRYLLRIRTHDALVRSKVSSTAYDGRAALWACK
jgi:hypothetical protein